MGEQRELVRIFVKETGNGFQATGRDRGEGYLGTEFGVTEAHAVAAVKKRVRKAGHTITEHLEIVSGERKRPAKVGPDRITRH